MDGYVIKTKPSVMRDDPTKGKTATLKRKRGQDDVAPSNKAKHPLSGAITRENAPILKSLNSKQPNVVTHSDVYSRTAHVQSCASGHQENHAMKAGSWTRKRNYKLSLQAKEKVTNLFDGLVFYLSGPTGALSVQQMIALIQEQAGQVRYMFSSECTHIVSNSTLSGKKNDDYLRVNSRKPKAKLVKPEWVIDSVENGKRLPEHPYAIRIDQNQGSLTGHLDVKRSPRLANVQKQAAAMMTESQQRQSEEGALLVSQQESGAGVITTSQDSDDDMPPSAQRPTQR